MPVRSLSRDGRPEVGGIPMGISHPGYVTQDIRATSEFYTRILGLKLANSFMYAGMSTANETVETTGDSGTIPFFHIMFRLGDGSCIAFFEAPGLPEPSEPSHELYRTFQHLAFRVETIEELAEWKEWLTENGLDVNTVSHPDAGDSVYFHDKINNIRLELTAYYRDDFAYQDAHTQAELDAWLQAKDQALGAGQDLRAAMTEFVGRWNGNDHETA